jgi:ABC-type molybdate transport system substrate-binding protein
VLGIVYSTDAKVEPGVKVVGTFPADGHPPIIYPVAATATAKAEANDYVAFLRSDVSKRQRSQLPLRHHLAKRCEPALARCAAL